MVAKVAFIPLILESFAGGMYTEFDSLAATAEGMDTQEWEATISRDEQQAIIVNAKLGWLRRTLDHAVTE